MGKGIWNRGGCPDDRLRFRTQSIKRIVADIHPENLRSLRLAEKIGLREITAIEDAGSQHRLYFTETEALELRS